MVKNFIADPLGFLSGLGGLHDADVRRLNWDPTLRMLRLEVDDLYANWIGLPDYPGKTPSALVFFEVSAVDLRCEAQGDDCIRIYSLKATKGELLGHRLDLQLSPSGQIHLHFESVALEEITD